MKENVTPFSIEEAFFNFVYSLIETAMKYNCSLCIEEFVGYITIYTDCDVITLTMNDGEITETELKVARATHKELFGGEEEEEAED